jgi:phospholipid-binding lipoprotein MlaA
VVDGLFIDPIGYIDNVRLRNVLYVGKVITTRAQLLDATNLMDDAAIDPYAFQRDSWLQIREAQIAGKKQIDYDEYLDYLSEDDSFDFTTDKVIDASANENQNTESDSISHFKDSGSDEFNKTSQRPLASHLVSSL